MKKIIAASAALVFIAACESTSSLPYSTSAQNVIAAQQVLADADAQLSVGAFTASEGVAKPTCRMMGQLDVAPGKDIATFIRDAFEAEIFATGRLAPQATAVRGEVQAAEMSTIGTGDWTISLHVSSDANPQGYTVTTSHSFASSYSAYSACQNAATAFNPAVQALLNDVVTHPQFATLAD
jgi:uncharacterized lipoprotein YajG